jgi:hypothetical protein
MLQNRNFNLRKMNFINYWKIKVNSLGKQLNHVSRIIYVLQEI